MPVKSFGPRWKKTDSQMFWWKIILEIFEDHMLPCVYTRGSMVSHGLTCKMEKFYPKLINEMKEAALEIQPALNPKILMIDFEQAAMNGFKIIFHLQLRCCFFHLGQSIYRIFDKSSVFSE
jgi:hypothetical protein